MFSPPKMRIAMQVLVSAGSGLVDYLVFPVFILPVCLVYLLVARILSMVIPLLILPTLLILRPFYWAVPLARAAFDSQHPIYVRWCVAIPDSRSS